MILTADALRLPFADASFDLVFTAPPWDDLDVIMRARPELRRVLTRKGRMVMVLPHLDDPALATLAITNRDWTERQQLAIDKPNTNRGWRYRSLPDDLVARVLHLTKACRILDPFCGAGSVVKGARRLGRFAVGCDLDPIATALAAT